MTKARITVTGRHGDHMKVYVLKELYQGGQSIKGVFSSIDRAKYWAVFHEKDSNIARHMIEEHEIDEAKHWDDCPCEAEISVCTACGHSEEVKKWEWPL